MTRFLKTQSVPRQGSTLSEVLVSILVLSIGLISVASLFPLAVIRGVRANQVTQGTILRYAAESQFDAIMLDPNWKYWMFSVNPDNVTYLDQTSHPNPVTNPADPRGNHFPGLNGDDDGNGWANVQEINNDQLGSAGWLPGRDGVYGVPGVNVIPGYSDNTGDISDDIPILATSEVRYAGADARAVVIDPIGWWEMTSSREVFGGRDVGGAATSSVLPRLNGGHRGNNTYQGDQPRVRPTFVRTDPLTGVLDELPAPSSAGLPAAENYFLGGYGFDEATARELATIQDQFSTILDIDYADVADPGTIGRRDQLSLPTTLPVDILTDVIATIEAGGTVKATFFGIIDDNIGDLIPPKRTILSRILSHEFDANGNSVLDLDEDVDSDSTRDLMSTTSRVMKWRTDEELPANFQVERIVLQTLQEDFTWLITARMPSPPPSPMEVDVVVFFNRRFEVQDELPYTCTRVPGASALFYTIDYSASGFPKPNWVRAGGFMFDVEHGEWYRIVNVFDPENGTDIQITLERDVRETPDGPADDPNTIQAAFMRGVVEVFPLEVK